MTPDEVRVIADELNAYATRFAPRDWSYSRDLGIISEIRFNDPYQTVRARIRRSSRLLFERRTKNDWLRISRWRVALYCLRRDKNLPDGILDGGSIITFWEETGEYLQYVQPSVGELVARWLTSEPENPHAQAIAAEMRRIQDAYMKRLAPSVPESLPVPEPKGGLTMKDDITLAEEAATGVTKQQEAAERIKPLFASYVRQVDPSGSEDDQTNLSDLLADIMHWAKSEGIDFESALSTAQMHFSCETNDE